METLQELLHFAKEADSAYVHSGLSTLWKSGRWLDRDTATWGMGRWGLGKRLVRFGGRRVANQCGIRFPISPMCYFKGAIPTSFH